jgi:hypothetical protein
MDNAGSAVNAGNGGSAGSAVNAGKVDFAPSSETPNFALSFRLQDASSGGPGGYVWQAGNAKNAANASQSLVGEAPG